MLIDEAGPSTACRMRGIDSSRLGCRRKIKEISSKNQANGKVSPQSGDTKQIERLDFDGAGFTTLPEGLRRQLIAYGGNFPSISRGIRNRISLQLAT